MSVAYTRPLITFALISYHEEKYIHDAVQAAFAQTYQPLEIILSNDCSTDRTFEIICSMASQYRGPHKIVLNRNEVNLGTGGHINRIMELAHGEIIVIAAGDDISLPERTEKVYEAFRQGGGSVKSFFSNARIMDESGKEEGLQYTVPPLNEQFLLENIIPDRVFGIVAGSSHAWTRDLFETFGSLQTPLSVEDSAIAFRSALLGRIAYSDQPLVKHRRHANNTWSYTVRDPVRDVRYQTFERKAILENWLHDLQILSNKEPERSRGLDAYRNILTAKMDELQEDILLFESGWTKRASLLTTKMLHGMPLSTARKKMGLFLMPHIYQQYVLLKYKMKPWRG